jgi:biotin carboxylase
MISELHLRIWFNETWRGTYQFIKLLRQGASPRRLTIIGSHPIPSTPFLQACDAVITEPGAEGDAFVAAALRVCERYRIDVFVPGRNMLAVAGRIADFTAAGVRVICSPAEAIALFATKSGQYAAMRARGLPVPRTIAVTTLAQYQDAYAALAAGGSAVCVKPDVDHGGQGFRIIDPEAERIDALFESPSVRVSPSTIERLLGAVDRFAPLIVGEYLEGPEFSIDVLSDDQTVYAAIPRGKSGPPWTREIVDDPALVDLASRVVREFGLRYLSNVQIRFTAGEPRILEVNTRAASGTYQSAASGLNLPWACLRLALGEPVNLPEPGLPCTLIAYNEAIPMNPPVDPDGPQSLVTAVA